MSDYRWGWATFHYGRWKFDDYYGWEWIPGHEWAPAWVSWRHGGGFFGWAPLLPGISVNISFGGGNRIPDNYWVCAPQEYITRPNVYDYCAPALNVVNIIHNTTIINNTYINENHTYVTGPRIDEIERVTNRPVNVYRINNDYAPGRASIHNNVVNIFRPQINVSGNARPERVVDGNAYRIQHPEQAIANRGFNGAPAFNHRNAATLASTAKAAAPDNRVVHFNPVNNRQGSFRPGNQSSAQSMAPAQKQPVNRNNFPADNRNGQVNNRNERNQRQQAMQQPNQQVNRNNFPADNRNGQVSSRNAFNQDQQRQQQMMQQNQQRQQQQAQAKQQQYQQRQQQMMQQNQQRQQQQAQAKQQQYQQRQQQMQQQNQQRQQQAQARQQQDQQRQQEMQQQNQQRQQQQAQARQQQDQQRQQQMQQQNQQRQQQVQAEQQQDQQRQQQMQQQNQQRQQNQAQARQQQDQQRQQQQLAKQQQAQQRQRI